MGTLSGFEDRDRDAAGRPRNARPRDGLGRPLPPGAPGVPTTPEDVSLTPAQTLAEAQRLLDDGLPFHAHEVLEAAWKVAPEGERELWRGLAQVAVGLTHLRRGNAVGGARLLRRAADRIEDYAIRPPHGISVGELVGWARDLADSVERDAVERDHVGRDPVERDPVATGTRQVATSPRLTGQEAAVGDIPLGGGRRDDQTASA